jgi:hypothetical protein
MGMLTQLSTVKARLGITSADDDVLLNRMIVGISSRFDTLCNRQFSRQDDMAEEFNADETELRVRCYPMESVDHFELKTSEREGWLVVAPTPDFIIRRDCIVSLYGRLGSWQQRGRIIYTGGYVMPGDEVKEGQSPLPQDVEIACLEQIAYWYQKRTSLGLTRVTDTAGLTTVTLQEDLLSTVQSTLDRYVRWLN